MPSCLTWTHNGMLVLGRGVILQEGSHLHCTVEHVGFLPSEFERTRWCMNLVLLMQQECEDTESWHGIGPSYSSDQ